jgi:hypothetical protein
MRDVPYDTEYIVGLEHFLRHSDEDTADAMAFVSALRAQFPEFLSKFATKRLAWLDVGIGPATKPLRIVLGAPGFSGMNTECRGDIRIDAVEPSEYWVERAVANFEKSCCSSLLGVVYKTTWEQFSRSVLPRPAGKYALVTFFHSIYGIELSSLKNLVSFLEPSGLACICVESASSDLNKIKQQFFPRIHGARPLTADDVFRYFSGIRQVTVSMSPDIEQRYYVSSLLKGNIQAITFALQLRARHHAALSKNGLREELIGAVRALAKNSSHGCFLEVPDRMIWIQPKA